MDKRFFAAILALATLLAPPALAQMPLYKHDHLNIFPAASVAVHGALKADGDLPIGKTLRSCA